MEIVNGEGQVQVHLKTKQEQYAVPDVPYSIEGTVTSKELNALLEVLLNQNTPEDEHILVEFDFLVSNEYIKGRLCDHLREKEISFEDTIDIEYVERFPAPEPQDCLLHDDWVATVHTCDDWILTGCYDNSINIWNTKGKHVLTVPGHVLSVKAVSWISVDYERGTFISASQDQTAMLWEWVVENNTAECIAVCKGHERAIDCVDVSPDKKLFATGSWDTMLKIWSAEIDDSNEVSPKRAKQKGSTRTPILTLQGHRECVSAVQWCDSDSVLTSCWDHTMKIWDLNLEGVKSEISTNKAIFDASYSKLNHLIVTASADRNVRLYDSRTNRGSVICNTFLGHTEWVTTVCWSTTEEHLFVSGSYDNKNKLWDCRSPKAPLYDMLGHSDKVLSIDWSNSKYIVSGGTDNSVRIFKNKKAVQIDSLDTK